MAMDATRLGNDIADRVIVAFDLTTYPGFDDAKLRLFTKQIADATVAELTANAELRDAEVTNPAVTGDCPVGGGPLTSGTITDPTVNGGIE